MRCCAEIIPTKQCHNDVIFNGLLCEIHENCQDLKIYDETLENIKFDYFMNIYKPDDKCHFGGKNRCTKDVCSLNVFSCEEHQNQLTCDEFESYKNILKESVILQHFKQKKVAESAEDFMKLSHDEKEKRMMKNLKNRILKSNISDEHAIDALIAASDDLIFKNNISTKLFVDAIAYSRN